MLDLWFSRRIGRQCRGEAYYFRFADDFLACFQHKADAEYFMRTLSARLKDFGLELAEEKTRCIEFGRFARENARRRGRKSEEFTFLGFTHYCGKTKKGHFKVKRRTDRKRLCMRINEFTNWARLSKNVLTKGVMLRRAKIQVAGHLNYYAITDNAKACNTYMRHVTRNLLKWLNRKSQKNTYTWEGYLQALEW